jgi:hypothetical protein
MSMRSAEAANKQHMEGVKKLAKISPAGYPSEKHIEIATLEVK